MKTLKTHWIEFCCIGTVIVIHIFLFAGTYQGDHIDAETAGQYGDFVGGYIGTIFLVISVALLAASYRNQKSTNDRTLQEQITTNEKTAFESRFFELLRYHRENVSEISIGSNRTGRRVFVSMIREFREALEVVDQSCSEVDATYQREKRVDLAYMAFYYGVGPNSSRVLRGSIGYHPNSLVDFVIQKMENIQVQYRFNSDELNKPGIAGSRIDWLKNETATLTRLPYCPFDGHQSRLGHYYRHLYQLVKYAKKHAPKGTATDYADIVRAQLTNHEQALLCLNARSTIGALWITDDYLTDFSMIQNIPESFFDPIKELNLKIAFPKIKFEFEKGGKSPTEPNRASEITNSDE